ncbi:MAG: preprotein translocase subunit SecG [Bacteroidales bacterium]|jgi:preprotein translocase subunit SecG|nr:preprotein translocase subunit SecG [Bacteroidales bacterium]MDD2569625.1 preprotein translocase subunit SecG [Bacteroidales bacterium]MDD3384606.1 preprotein translocase subunit SecG [Bacteroidales bacterium]MDD3870714.1 preprotein translocase subunit SecG [Bacteroidales bacterium]MDD4812826.1 preprotein translocase subunit SecG [Bacteroidales bacterium]
MYIFLSVLILIVCVLLALIVLVQNSKGGGLAANFSSSSQVMGVRKTNDFLEKSTWTLAIALLVLCLAASLSIPHQNEQVTRSAIEQQIENAVDPGQVPQFPTSPESTEGGEN